MKKFKDNPFVIKWMKKLNKYPESFISLKQQQTHE